MPSLSSTQAVRVQFRYGGSGTETDSCKSGSYNDRDDLVFDVDSLGKNVRRRIDRI